MGKGQTFLSKPERNKIGNVFRHLRIVISDPNDNMEYLVVSVTSWHDGVRGQDDSCILDQGCHSFIKQKSWIDFSRSRAMSYVEIFNGLKKGILIEKKDLDPSIVKQIQIAAAKSDYIPEELVGFFKYF